MTSAKPLTSNSVSPSTSRTRPVQMQHTTPASVQLGLCRFSTLQMHGVAQCSEARRAASQIHTSYRIVLYQGN